MVKRAVVILGLLGTTAIVCWFFPLFHVVPVGSAQFGDPKAEFDAAKIATSIWSDQIVPSLDQAADATAVLAAIREDPQHARNQYGRSAGLGRTALYVLRGRGTIVSVGRDGVGVVLDSDAGKPDVVLQIGPLFRNTVRDATGLLSASDYPNSQQFNEISASLNHIVESTLIPQLKGEARVGRPIEFVGCAEVLHLPEDVSPLKVIPLRVQFE